MSLLTVYCDESGTDHANRVATVCGYIGQAKEWWHFEKDWKPILKKYGVKTMHRVDLENWRGEFTAARRWNPKRRRAFLRELHPIIKSRTKVAIGSAVIKEDWEEVMPSWLKRGMGGVYGWCAHECVAAVRVWCERPIHKHRRAINWVFEKGADGQSRVSAMFEELDRHPTLGTEFRIGSLSFASKDVVPLQAADTLAYEIFKQIENQIVDRGEHHNVRFSVRDLIREQDPPYLKYWDRARLREWLTANQKRGSLEGMRRAWT